MGDGIGTKSGIYSDPSDVSVKRIRVSKKKIKKQKKD